MTVKKKIAWTAVIVWMGVIFYLSDQPATESNELSNKITENIITIVDTIFSSVNLDINSFNHIVRKNAHFFAYSMLAVFVINALSKSGMRWYRNSIVTLGVCIIYAVSDEVHQLVVPGRSGELRDVLIDSAGASVGICFYWMVTKIFERWRRMKIWQ
ncbi:VanZ family protein [Virgibacillus sp. NKC19-3]|uniref:VanZ family protein n=1 Tax=Virgibacillus saliphilus TaxID=2831674 RepID=UPI001C9A6A20|nr:VanZ family protein [Virgibacillus sp. NKC19-3]MBY7144348.1 VanZ family protein [Virgibacillus sp. NKC19-3]